MESKFNRGVEDEKKTIMLFVSDILDYKKYYIIDFRRAVFSEAARFLYLLRDGEL